MAPRYKLLCLTIINRGSIETIMAMSPTAFIVPSSKQTTIKSGPNTITYYDHVSTTLLLL